MAKSNCRWCGHNGAKGRVLNTEAGPEKVEFTEVGLNIKETEVILLWETNKRGPAGTRFSKAETAGEKYMQ